MYTSHHVISRHTTSHTLHTLYKLPCIPSHCMTWLYTYIICISDVYHIDTHTGSVVATRLVGTWYLLKKISHFNSCHWVIYVQFHKIPLMESHYQEVPGPLSTTTSRAALYFGVDRTPRYWSVRLPNEVWSTNIPQLTTNQPLFISCNYIYKYTYVHLYPFSLMVKIPIKWLPYTTIINQQGLNAATFSRLRTGAENRLVKSPSWSSPKPVTFLKRTRSETLLARQNWIEQRYVYIYN